MRSGLRPCEVPPCEYSVCGMPLRAATGGWQSPNLSQQVVMLARRAMCASAGWECSPPAPRSARGTVGRFEYLTRRSAVFKVFAMAQTTFFLRFSLTYALRLGFAQCCICVPKSTALGMRRIARFAIVDISRRTHL